MYARELRKWSLKYQMSHLWLSAMVTMLLLIIYCPNATSMHLPINTNTRDTALRIPSTDSRTYNWWLDRLSTSNSNRISSKQTNSDSSSNLSSSISNTNNNYNSYNPLAVFSDLRNHNARARAPVNAATSAADSINSNSNNSNSKKDNDNNYYVPNVPNSNSQINLNINSYANSLTKSAYDYSNSRSSSSNKLRRHTNQPNANYHSPVRVVKPPLPHSSVHPLRYDIATFHVSSESSASTSPSTLEFGEQRRRSLLRQQAHDRTMLLAARSRRDSATSSASLGYLRNKPGMTTGSGSYNHNHPKHHNNNKNNNNKNHKRPRRYCSARDPAQLAFKAPTVFEGKIISMTSNRKANFAATFEVKEVFKQQEDISLQKHLRLQFAYRNSNPECDIYREVMRPRGLVRDDELEQGQHYVMFVKQIDLRNFTILGRPIPKTTRVINAVKNAVSENYAQNATIKSLTAFNQRGEIGKELRIVCRVQGQPPPKVTWFKDFKSINRNRKVYKFIHHKKTSELIIKSFISSDAGIYECRAKNKVNQTLAKKTIVIEPPDQRYYAPPQQSGEKCPEDRSEVQCFNGGTCTFFKEILQYSCICTGDFVGERCDRKQVNNTAPIQKYKTGYIADDPNVFEDGVTKDSDENDENDEDDDFIYPPTKDPFFEKFT